MDHPKRASETGGARLSFDRRVRLEFHGSKISSDGGLLLFRELDEVLGLHDIADGILRDTRTGHNRLHSLVGLLRQSVFGRLAGYDDVNDADRLAFDPVMRQVVGGRAVDAKAASASLMGRFETEVLAATYNRSALTDLSGRWIDRVHHRKPPKWITLDMDSWVSPTHGAQEGTAWNGHFGCRCYHPLFVFNLAAETENRAQFLRQVPKQRRKSYRPLDRGKHRQLARKGILLGECRLKPAKRSNLKSFFQDVID